MEFHREVKNAKFLDPHRSFARYMKSIEYRSDPLTGDSARVSADRASRVKQAQGATVDLADIMAHSAKDCCFCPGNIDTGATRFVPDFLPVDKGRIAVGKCMLFPNLHPFTEFHAVATLTDRHYLELDEFTVAMIEDNLEAARQYVIAVNRYDGKAKYPVWLWNHLPPSGASILHPHSQVSVERGPLSELKIVLHKSREYMRRKGFDFWRELIAAEKEAGERFIGENASVSVIASFAPKGNREIQIVSNQVSSLTDLDRRYTRDFADAIVRVLRGYKSMGMNSFNIVTYSGAIDERLDYFRFSARIISRPVFLPFYTNDTGSIERFYRISIIEALPEQVASEVRKQFRD